MTRLSRCVGLWLRLVALVPFAAGGCDGNDAADARANAGNEAPPAGKTAADKSPASTTPASKGVPSGGAGAANGDASGDATNANATAKRGLSPSDPPGSEPAAVRNDDVLATLDKRVARVAKLAREIEKAPENADGILDAADLSRADLEDLIYTIATDPKLAKQYQLALAGE